MKATSLTGSGHSCDRTDSQALQNRDGATLHGRLAKRSRQGERRHRPATSQHEASISDSRVVRVAPGYSDTTVDAVVTTSNGEKPLMLILDDSGKLLAWKWVGEVMPIETTALRFTEDLAEGRWVEAAVVWRSTSRRNWHPVICSANGPSWHASPVDSSR